MKKRIVFSLLIVLVLCFMTACGESDNGKINNNTEQNNFLWQISVINAEMTDNLANTQTFVLYGGSTEDVKYTKSASEGNTFLLLELKINKNGVGGKPFSWSDVYVEDNKGNKYLRHENDVFLEDYDLPRLKATDLTIGNNSGCVCFEVPSDIELQGLKFVHEAEEGKNVIEIDVLQK